MKHRRAGHDLAMRDAASGMDQEQDSSEPPEKPKGEASRTPGGSPAETPFDLWLNRSLHALYDGVTQEPIPAELLKLIAEDKTRQRGG